MTLNNIFGARKLWSNLSKSDTVKVDVFDTNKCQVVYKNYIINHGNEDYEFDTNIWSYDDNIIPQIRLILKDVA